VTWGTDYNGEAPVPAGLHDVIAISAGYDYSLALLKGGTVVAWGDKYRPIRRSASSRCPKGCQA